MENDFTQKHTENRNSTEKKQLYSHFKAVGLKYIIFNIK